MKRALPLGLARISGAAALMRARHLLLCCLLAIPVHIAQSAPNAVADWSQIVQPAILDGGGATRSPASSEILHAMVAIAMYDAVIAIEGGFQPFAVSVSTWPGADVNAAVGTAAYLTARGRVASSQHAYLDQQYADHLAGIPGGVSKADGIDVGEAVAEFLLALRADDGYNDLVLYQCSSIPPPAGEFEPNAGCPTQLTDRQPGDVRLGGIRPFTFADPSRFRPNGPEPMTSRTYLDDFIETRDYGRADSTFRSLDQTDIAYFWSEHSYVHWNRNLISLAESYELSVQDTARLFAMVHTAAADALIAGFEAKYHYNAWRPRTAIPRADTDPNPKTDADPAWLPELSVNHPEYPSAHGFWSTALTDVVSAFFGTNKVRWTIETSKAAVPKVARTERTYENLNALMREIDDARVWAGLHWRHSMRHGDQIGRKVASHVVKNFFRPTP